MSDTSTDRDAERADTGDEELVRSSGDEASERPAVASEDAPEGAEGLTGADAGGGPPDGDDPADDRGTGGGDGEPEPEDEDGEPEAGDPVGDEEGSDEEPRGELGSDGEDLEPDDEAAPPVIGCLRCDARVPLGSRYCPRCGTPLVRSGEDAAVRLSRTRRNAPMLVRLVVPAIVAAIVGVVAWLAVLHDPTAAFDRDLEQQLEIAVDANRELSATLTALKPGDATPPVLARAQRALDGVTAARDGLDRLDVPDGDEGRVTRARAALTSDLRYLATVVAVLRDVRSDQLSELGSASAGAAAALRTISDEVEIDGAIDGTRELGIAVRAARRSAGGGGSSRAASPTTSPFLAAIDTVLGDQRPALDATRRAFALLRAARDGATTYDGPGEAPRDAGAAVREADKLLQQVAEQRPAGAAAARGVTARQENQQSIVAKLAAAFEAAGRSATTLVSCLDEDGEAVAKAERCLTAVRGDSERENDARAAFLASIAPARQAADLSPLSADF
ncbi:zinc ribbon domain-containing protein [Patulibacter brassicae]|jgi:hypothetical protein|uniref:Zinc ribbon domain-containing protein n=1 Tax=Patulibacter brassicae TaxID=1705717 RepID=A0ABU4VPM2_9ACTN|nr:zinc ribbon domain-containing protein [Patulibacter brassicae]MDX8153584.1 zinc ribbon domain-containing protein [Patulibacter brassicae]